MNSAHSYSEGAEVPEDKTPQSKDLHWLGKYMIMARNEAIDECIALIGQQFYPINYQTWPEVKKKLESLKNKPI